MRARHTHETARAQAQLQIFSHHGVAETGLLHFDTHLSTRKLSADWPRDKIPNRRKRITGDLGA